MTSTYDAYLANDRTLDDPAGHRRRGERRGAAPIFYSRRSTNFAIDFGAIEATLVSVDGNPIVPQALRLLPIAVSQPADVVLRIPANGQRSLSSRVG